MHDLQCVPMSCVLFKVLCKIQDTSLKLFFASTNYINILLARGNNFGIFLI